VLDDGAGVERAGCDSFRVGSFGGQRIKVTGFAGAGTHENDLPGTPTDVKNVRRTLGAFGFEDSTTIQLFDRSASRRWILGRQSAACSPAG
jgi:hypothetical protein